MLSTQHSVLDNPRLPPPPGGARKECVLWFVYGWARGDEQKARVVIEAMFALAQHQSISGVAGRHGFERQTVHRWLNEVMEGMKRAAVVAKVEC